MTSSAGNSTGGRPVILFHRRFRRYSGGHGKVWDYFNHARDFGFEARVFLTPDSVRDDTNPWVRAGAAIASRWDPQSADLLFVAGMDWQAVPEDLSQEIAIINLIQGTRHADPAGPLFGFLSRRAIRICVSEAVRDAIAHTGRVSGPIRVIPNGVQLPAVEPAGSESDVVVVSTKRPHLGRAVARALRESGAVVDVIDEHIPRGEFLGRIAAARVALLLPRPVEGFYLPGLESMAIGTAVVMPDCGGNRSYALDGVNCLMPPATSGELQAAVGLLLADGPERHRLAAAARVAARHHDLTGERAAVLALLGDVDRLWAEATKRLDAP